jgi:AP-4 complex subunit epsilon-1
MNPLDEYHLDLRGYKIPFLENLSATNDQFGTIDLTDNEMVTMVLFKMWKTYPSAIDQIDGKMKKALCDKDPQVMAATLNYFADVVKKSPSDYKDLVNSFVVILRQIVEHRLPREYDYHRIPAPWIQMKILEILSFLGADDKTASENMFEIIS